MLSLSLLLPFGIRQGKPLGPTYVSARPGVSITRPMCSFWYPDLESCRWFDGLSYDLAKEARLLAVEASVGALVLPFARRVENQFVLGI